MVELYERLRGEILVNTTTAGDQLHPVITALAGGGYVVTWVSSGQDGSSWGIYAQRYAADGTAVGGEFRVNTTTADSQEQPAITALADGGFVVTWTSWNQDGSFSGIYAQRYGADGAAVGGEFLVNTSTANYESVPAITALSDGGFVVSWQAGDIYAQRYAADGRPIGGEFVVNTTTLDVQQQSAITALADGGFVVSWQSYDVDEGGIYAQRYGADGRPVGVEFRVNTTTSDIQISPAITALADGGFVVTWMSYAQDGNRFGIYAQRYGADGGAVGGEFRVNTTTWSSQEQPSVTALSNGGFMVTWQSADQDGSSYGVYAQIYAADGSRAGGEFRVNTTTFDNQSAASLTQLADGTLAVTWTSWNQDGSGSGVYVQRFSVDVDGITDIDLSNLTLSEVSIENVAVAMLSDNGSVNGAVTYQIISDSSNGAFGINGNQLIVADSALLNFESATSVTITVRATDENGNSYDQVVTLAIGDSANETRFAAGQEFQVNTTTQSDQLNQAITGLSDGGFVVSWQSLYQDGSGWGIYAQRYDAEGTPVGGEFQVNTTTLNSQVNASVLALSGGGFVVTWQSWGQDGGGWGIYAQRYGADGTPAGGEFLVNTTTFSDQIDASTSALPGGGFVVTWVSLDDLGRGIYAQRYAADGTAVGGEFRVNTTTSDNQEAPSITALADGGFVVSWQSANQDGSIWGIYAQRYGADGTAVGGEFRVNTTTALEQVDPAVAALADGGFVITWESNNQDGSGYGVYAQRYGADGRAVGGEFRVNTATADHQANPSITALGDGGFVISWNSSNQDGSFYGVYAQRYGADGRPAGREFLVNATTAGDQFYPAIAALAGGGFAVSWQSVNQDGSGHGIYARTFTPANISIAEADAFTTGDTAEFAGNVLLDNGSGADHDQTGAMLQVGAVNGNAVAVGQQVTLPSGALLILNADGTFSYDPNGAFDALPGPDSGASNADPAIDSFTYSLADGATATVTVTINGTSAGDDLVQGTSGNDSLNGGIGADTMIGYAGDDTYMVDSAGDVITELAGEGVDQVFASVSHRLAANVENLTLTGTAAINGTGNALANRITGNAAANLLNGGIGADTMIGGAGDDSYVVDDGGDLVTEAAGEGTDQVLSSISHTLAANVEYLTLTGTAAIDGTGNSLHNRLIGNSAANVLTGGGGNDRLNGGAGADTLIGGTGNDIYFIDNAGDVVTEAASQGLDRVYTAMSHTLADNVEHLVLTGTSAIDGTGNASSNNIIGNSAANVLTGGAGHDTLNGGGGADSLIGGTGNDTYLVDDIGDVITEALSEGSDRVLASASYTLSDNVEHLTLTGTADISATGNALNNSIRGNSGANTLSGGGGHDTLNGLAGADTLMGGTGNDTYIIDGVDDVVTEVAGEGNDLVKASISYTLGTNVERLTLTGTRAIDGTGNSVANVMTGNGAANTIRGEGGRDNLSGGGGADNLYGGLANDRLTGGTGSDNFYFDTALDAAWNVDTITDFSAAADSIYLAMSVFTGIGAAGTLSASAFHVGTAAADADDRIIYDQATGNLYYDADGNGSGTAVLFAQVTAGTALTNADFIVF